MNRRLEKTKILCLWEHKRHHIPAVLHLPSDLKHSLPGAHWPGTLFMCPAAGEAHLSCDRIGAEGCSGTGLSRECCLGPHPAPF